MAKNLPAKQKTWVPFLGWEDALGKELTTHSSMLAWRIQRTEELFGPQSTGSQRVGHSWATKQQEVAETDLKPGLCGPKSCVFLLKTVTDSGMELCGIRLESEEPGWLADGGGGEHCGSKGEEGIKVVSRLIVLKDKGKLGRKRIWVRWSGCGKKISSGLPAFAVVLQSRSGHLADTWKYKAPRLERCHG